MTRIYVEHLYKTIHGNEVLRDINLELNKGEICALIGPNGVGKTTFIKCILGLLFPDSGRIEINQEPLANGSNAKSLRKMGIVLQYPESISSLTVKQVFAEHFHYLGVKNNIPIEELLRKVSLSVSLGMKIGNMSLGMKQRLMIALALSHQPDIVILDEPFNGLDIDGILLMKQLFKEFVQQGKSILIASHSLPELENFIDSTVFLFHGKNTEKQRVEDILNDYDGGLQQYYHTLKGGNIFE